MIRARILGHEGQTIQNLEIDSPTDVLKVPILPRLNMAKWVSEESVPPDEVSYKEAIAYYERTDGGGTRIYRLKVNL